jgi:hypothetical protein
MSLIDELDLVTSKKTLYLNTGTPLDIFNGYYDTNIDGNTILNGGLGLITGISGKYQTWKTTTIESMLSRSMVIYPDSETIIWDTEQNKNNKRRYDYLAGRNDTYVSDRLKIIDTTYYDLDAWWKMVIKLGQTKESNKKDLMVETPFLDPATKKPIKMWIPTFIVVDSWSKAFTSEEANAVNAISDNDKKRMSSISDGSLNTVYMRDANTKTIILRQMPRIAAMYGIYFILVAHVGNKVNLTGRPEAKEFQFMKQDEKIKNVGSQFGFLTTTLIQSMGSNSLLNSVRDGSLYPSSKNDNSKIDLNEVKCFTIRGKMNSAGMSIPVVESGNEGILPGLSWFNYLRDYNNDFGLEGKGKQSSKCLLLPNLTFNRLNIRSILKTNYELERALQILGEYCFIQNNWFTTNLSADFTKKPEELVDKLLNNQKPVINDILNSRGYWTYDKKEKRSYLSTFDLVSLIFDKK